MTRAACFLVCWILTALLPATGVPWAGLEMEGQVTGVIDGDSLDLRVTKGPQPGQRVKLRLYGIDAPERAQPFYAFAKAEVSRLAYGKEVRVRVRETDAYGRAVVWITLPDGSAVNLELVRRGCAWWYRHFAPDDSELREAEQEARLAKRGLWVDPKPVAPWNFRRRSKRR